MIIATSLSVSCWIGYNLSPWNCAQKTGYFAKNTAWLFLCNLGEQTEAILKYSAKIHERNIHAQVGLRGMHTDENFVEIQRKIKNVVSII